MTGIITDEISRRVNRFNDDQARVNREYEQRIKALETELLELQHRVSVLAKLLISKQLLSAAEFAALLADTRAE